MKVKIKKIKTFQNLKKKKKKKKIQTPRLKKKVNQTIKVCMCGKILMVMNCIQFLKQSLKEKSIFVKCNKLCTNLFIQR